jgi:hypothetical protein
MYVFITGVELDFWSLSVPSSYPLTGPSLIGFISRVQQQSATDTRLSIFRHSMERSWRSGSFICRLKPLENLHQTHRCYTIKNGQVLPFLASRTQYTGRKSNLGDRYANASTKTGAATYSFRSVRRQCDDPEVMTLYVKKSHTNAGILIGIVYWTSCTVDEFNVRLLYLFGNEIRIFERICNYCQQYIWEVRCILRHLQKAIPWGHCIIEERV